MKGYDPVVLVTSTVLLAIVALSAGLIPAYRASKSGSDDGAALPVISCS